MDTHKIKNGINKDVLSLHLKYIVKVFYTIRSFSLTLTAGAAYIRVFIFYKHIKYHILNM